MGSSSEDASDADEAVKHADLALARKAAQGDSAAVAEVFALLRAEGERAARRFHLSSSSGDEITQLLAERLLASKDSPLARTYAGRGSLRMWLRTLALRQAALRKGPAEARMTGPEILLERLVTSGRVDLAVLKAEQAPHVRDALQKALASLSVHERTVLRLQLLGGWSIDELAARYQVHRATAARWLQRIRAKLLEHVQGMVGTELKLSPDDLNSVMRLLRSEVELSLERVLDVDDGPDVTRRG